MLVRAAVTCCRRRARSDLTERIVTSPRTWEPARCADSTQPFGSGGNDVRGYVFDPSRLGRRRRPREDPYAVARQLLRDYLGGDPLAEARRRAQRDPQLRAMLATV